MRTYPVIGATVAEYEEYQGVRLRDDYFWQLWQAGAAPILLPPLTPQPELIAELLDAVDGVLLTGGGDFCDPPSRRDGFEMALIKAAWERRTPILGICRGMQAMALALGGELWQDIGERPGPALRHQQWQSRRLPSHEVRLLPPLTEIYGAERLAVNSHHHQAVRDLPRGFDLAAVAEDGIIEAISAPGRFTIGVQWHPEALSGHEALFAAFTQAAKRLF